MKALATSGNFIPNLVLLLMNYRSDPNISQLPSKRCLERNMPNGFDKKEDDDEEENTQLHGFLAKATPIMLSRVINPAS